MAGTVEGKIVLVTGGASGIGRAAAMAFAREGASVVLSDVNIDGGEETAAAIRTAGGQATFVRCDVSQSAEVAALVSGAVEAYGGVDCAFNNAGIAGKIGATADCTEENWDQTLGTNLKGIWLCMKYEIPAIRARGGGAIVNTSSLMGITGLADWPAYVASKHGVVGLTRTAAVEYAADRIRVNAICPGGVRTPMARNFGADVDAEVDPTAPAVGRMALPEEIAEVVLWLCSDGAHYVSGQAITVDGGSFAGIGRR